jgi:single-strand DNA-binding protein
MSLSKIVVSGRVIRAPEKRFTPSTNVAVTEFSIAVESPPRDGQVETTPVKVITWRDLAERCSTEVKKGDLVAVDGRLQINNYQSQDGQKRREVEVDAVSVENLSNLTVSQGSFSEEKGEANLAKAGVKGGQKAKPAGDTDDLDAIFASDDEIPF